MNMVFVFSEPTQIYRFLRTRNLIAVSQFIPVVDTPYSASGFIND